MNLCLDLDCLKESADIVITKCEEILSDDRSGVINTLGLSMPDSLSAPEGGLSAACDCDDPRHTLEYYTYGSDSTVYYAVLAFPENMRFKLKVKNKMKDTKYTNFTCEQQLILFKRRIDDWRHLCEGNFIVIPEFNKKGSLHFNIIMAVKNSIQARDIIISLTDAYGVNYNYKNIFCNIQPVTNLHNLMEKYLKKVDGKEYQKTGLFYEYKNIA